MKRRPLGRAGIDVSVLGLGTVKLGRNTGVKYPHGFALPDDRTLTDLLAQARELGINLLDTAPAYGSSEERLGRLLAGQRDEWVVCTKVGEEFEHGRSHHDFSARHTRASIERSLRRLQTDYLDLVLIHSDGNDVDILERGEVVPELERCRQRGDIRAFGISHKTVAGGRRALECCDVIMAALNLDYRDELDLIADAGRRGVGVLVKKVFASGHAAQDPALRRQSLALALRSPGVGSLVLGTIDAAHLRQNAALAEAVSP